MAEPFSIAVGVLSVIKAARTAYKYGHVTSHAAEHVEPLLTELERLENVVFRISSFLSAGHDLSVRPLPSHLAALETLLVEAEANVTAAQGLVDAKLRKQSVTQPDEEAKLKPLSVVKRLNRIKHLTGELADLHQQLERAIAFRSIVVQSVLHEDISILRDDVHAQDVRTDIQDVKDMLRDTKAEVSAGSVRVQAAEIIRTLGNIEAQDVRHPVMEIKQSLSMLESKCDGYATASQVTVLTNLVEELPHRLRNDEQRIEERQSAELASFLHRISALLRGDGEGTSPLRRARTSKPSLKRKLARTTSRTQRKAPCQGLESEDVDSDAKSWRTATSGQCTPLIARAHTPATSKVNLHHWGDMIQDMSSRLSDDFERSGNWYPEQYTTTSKIPKFLCARFNLYLPEAQVMLKEWHIWWCDSPRRWRMLRVVAEEDLGENSEFRGSQNRIEWDPQYVWMPPDSPKLPCAIEELSTFVSDVQGLHDDVTNIKISRRADSVKAVLTESTDKPYEPRDVYSRSTYRSAETLLEVKDLGCRLIPENEVVIEKIISGFTAAVLIDKKRCIEKKLPLAPYHLIPFKYEMKALYHLRGCTGIVEFIGVEVDKQKKMLQGYIRAAEAYDLSSALKLAAVEQRRIAWSTREAWAGQVINGVFSAHRKGFVIGTLDVNEIGVDQSQRHACLLHVGHGLCHRNSGCLAPELRNRPNLSDDNMTTRQDIFALGLVLWLIAQRDLPADFILDPRVHGRKPWWRTLFCARAACRYGDVQFSDNDCQESHTDPVDLPPCERGVPMYFQHIIARCRQTEPEHRANAEEIRSLFRKGCAKAVPLKRKPGL